MPDPTQPQPPHDDTDYDADAPGPVKPRWGLHALLLLLTLGTTTCAGLPFGQEAALPMPEEHYWYVTLTDPHVWTQALAYALSVMAILFAHEMGHYLPARRYGVQVTPPYFLPGFPPFGTFGAFIRMQMDTLSASRLFWIGAGGPFAGFVVALPVLIIGLLLSDVQPVPPDLQGQQLGDSLLMWGLTQLMFPDVPKGHDVFLHPMAFAGWVGMFFTAFNLVPLSQLDGGHIAYTLFGRRFNRVAWGLLIALIVLGVVVFPGWLILALFVIVMGPQHPEVVEGQQVLQGKERWAGYAGLLLFALTFTPRPFQVPTLLSALLD